MNRVFLYGHLGADPELKMTNGGTPVMKLRLATSERQKKNDEWVDHTEWHNVVVWGKRAEGLAKFLAKGAALIVEGNIRTRSYEDRDGNKRYATEINANEVRAAGKREGGNGRDDRDDPPRPSQRQQAKPAPAPAPAASDDQPDFDDDDQIPF